MKKWSERSATVGGALLEVTVVFLIALGVCKLVYHFRYVPLLSQSMVVIVAAVFLYLPLGMILVARRSPEAYGMTVRDVGRSFKVALATSLCILPAFVLVYSVYQTVYLHQPVRFTVNMAWISTLLFHLFCVAFPEEIFYRGYMQSRLNEVYAKKYTFLGVRFGFGLLYTAFLFALGHYVIAYQVPTLATFFPGLVFGWLREKTGTVVASILFHALCNGVIVLVR